jgi:hypothetical protein
MAYSRLWLAAATLCLSCGSNFVSADNGTGGGTSSAGATGTSGGSTSAGGAHSGGAAGASAAGAGAGGASAGSGGAASGGATTGGAGGASQGGASGAGGSAGAVDCAALKTEYAADVDKARGCDSGSTDECSTSSTLPTIGCGCPTAVNAKSAYTTLAKAKYQAIQDAKCPAGPICNIACIAYTSVTCSAQMTTSGTAYECTGISGVPTN